MAKWSNPIPAVDAEPRVLRQIFSSIEKWSDTVGTGSGSTGPAGPAGPAGATGPAGPTGAASTVAGPTGPQGLTGADGPTGPQGVSGNISYRYSTTTTNADPGSGYFRLNSGTSSAVTRIYISNLDLNGLSQTGWFDVFDDSTSSIKGYVQLVSSQGFRTYYVNGTVTANTGYYSIPVTWVNSGGVHFNNAVHYIVFTRTGDLGGIGPTGAVGPAGPQGPMGLTGAVGPTGPQGTAGTNGTNGTNGSAATIAVGTTTTGAAGTSASVSNSGTSSAATFNFTIPQGPQGVAGPTGAQGPAGPTGPTGTPGTNGTNGTNGAAATIAVGTTTTGAAGTSASVTNSGTSSAAVFDFTVPKGDTGVGTPTGALVAYAAATAPAGWLLCDGSPQLKSAYPDLWTLIGNTYGTSTLTHFYLPDMRGRTPVALDNMGGTDAGRLSATNTLGGTGGTESFSAAQLVSHTHGTTITNGSVATSVHTHQEGNLAAAVGAANGNPALIGYEPGAIRPSGRGPASLVNYILGPMSVYNGGFGALAMNHYTRVYGDTGGPVGTASVGVTVNANTAQSSTSVMQPYILTYYIIKT